MSAPVESVKLPEGGDDVAPQRVKTPKPRRRKTVKPEVVVAPPLSDQDVSDSTLASDPPDAVDPTQKQVKPEYLCHKCDKTYKSKHGVKKHIEACTK